MVKIVTDTLGDIPEEIVKEYGISVVSLNLHFGQEVYRDQAEITTEEFYKKLTTSTVHPSSSAPPPGVFVELYKKLAKETKEILVVMVSRPISAIYESAVQAKDIAGVDCHIEVVDSGLIIGGELLAVLTAAKMAAKGATIDQIVPVLKDMAPKTHSIMAFDTLEYLRKGGRIGKGQAFLGGLLKLHPVLGLKDGEVAPFARTRNRQQATDFLVDFVKSFKSIESIVVEHATTADEMDALAARIQPIVPDIKIIKSRVSPVIGAHVGPHVLAVTVQEK